MHRIALGVMALVAFAAGPASADVPVSLRGSLSAMERQHEVALDLGYRFVRTVGELMVLEEEGELVRLMGNEDYGFRSGVESLVARPEMRTFLERLSAEYRAECGEQLVVTSLTRPTSRQPRNAHRLSVHPTGMAVDLRVSRQAECRSWLEGALLAMEEAGLLDVTRERSPPHYHVALFPDRYMAHVAPMLEAERAREERERSARLAMDTPHQLVPAAEAAPERVEAWRVLGLLSAGLLGIFALRRV